MATFAENFRKLTGLTWDVDALITNTPAEEQGELYAKLSWNIKRGIVLNTPENKELFKEVITDLADKLNIDLSADDVNGDSVIDAIDKRAKEDKSMVDIITGSSDSTTTAAPEVTTTPAPITTTTTEEPDSSFDD